MKRQIRSATGPYGNTVNVNLKQMELLRSTLQKAYDILEDMDDDTFNACDGEALINDLDIAVHEVATAVDTVKSFE